MENDSKRLLLDTGPLVALLVKNDENHTITKQALSQIIPPFKTVESVISEACFLMSRVSRCGPEEIIALGQRGLFESSFSLEREWTSIKKIMHKYSDQDISLADASLIRLAEQFDEPRILTFDSDFRHYRWKQHQKFVFMYDMIE